MIQRGPRNALYRFFHRLLYISVFLTPIVGGLKTLTPELLSKWEHRFSVLVTITQFVQSEAWWLLVLLSAIAGASKLICTYIGEPWAWQTIETTLEELQSHAFKKNVDPLHYHRVTLFKHKRCRFRICFGQWRSTFWPWGRGRGPCSGWLVPVARTKHTTQKTKTVFLAPDDADAAEGIAGQAWNRNVMIPVTDLPDLSTDQSETSISGYANRTWLSQKLIKQRIEMRLGIARSYLGIPIEVKGKRWGVLVLDSRSPDGIWSPEELRYDTYKVMAKFLERLLERG
jgi:hypothetical protein